MLASRVGVPPLIPKIPSTKRRKVSMDQVVSPTPQPLPTTPYMYRKNAFVEPSAGVHGVSAGSFAAIPFLISPTALITQVSPASVPQNPGKEILNE